MNWLFAVLICAGAVGLETMLAGKDPAARMKEFRQPGWAPSMAVWMAIGLGYYAICLWALQTVLAGSLDEAPRRIALILLVAVLVANALFNWILIVKRWFRGAFLYYFPYGLLVSALVVCMWPIDQLTACLFVGYLSYQVLAATWSYKVWQLNR